MYRHKLLTLIVTLIPATVGAQTTFVSIPDFLNVDIGDLRLLLGEDHTGFNSWTQGYEDTINHVLDQVAAEKPAFVLSAGDLVMGHWHVDTNNKRVFGNVNSDAGRERGIDEAGDFYYGVWKQRFTDRGLTEIYVTVGDHEIGDDVSRKWSGEGARLVPYYKAEFAEHFTTGFTNKPSAGQASETAYAVQRGNILIVTVDQFDYDSSKTTDAVAQQLDADQQVWLDGVLSAAAADPTVEHIIVQGHLPVHDSPTVPFRNSSNMKYTGGHQSQFWQSMANNGVDLYLAGEVHDDSARHNGGESLLQVITGGIVGESTTTQYMVGTIDGSVTTLEIRDISLTNIGVSTGTSIDPATVNSLWQTGHNRPHTDVVVTNPNALLRTIGGVVIDKSSGSPVHSEAWGAFDGLGARPVLPGAEEGNLLTNAGFEATLLNNNTQERDFNNIPGWSSTDIDLSSTRTGVRDGPGDTDDGFTGENRLFLHVGDGEVFQTTDYQIKLNESYELTFFARTISQHEARVGATIFYLDTDDNRIALASGDGVLLGEWGRFTLELDAFDIPGAAIGQYIGVAFDNTMSPSIGSESFVQLDHVSLTVPEPTSAVGLLAGMILLRRRRHG